MRDLRTDGGELGIEPEVGVAGRAERNRELCDTASEIEWVMNTPAKCWSSNSRSVSSLSRSLVISSTEPNGSSNSMIGGCSVNVRASEQRIRMPPESDLG